MRILERGVQDRRGHHSVLKFLGQTSCYRRELFFKGRKTNQKKEARAFPCLSDLFITRISDFSIGSRHWSKVFIGREQEEFRVCL